MALDIGNGEFSVYYNYQEVEGIESVDFTVDEKTVDLSTIKGQSISFPKSHSAQVKLTFIDTGIENLKKIIPDAFLATGELVPGQAAGNVVANASGAIALGYTGSTEVTLTAPLQLIPASGSDNHTVTVFDGVASLTNITLSDQVVKAEVTVRSEATGVQILKGAVTLVS